MNARLEDGTHQSLGVSFSYLRKGNSNGSIFGLGKEIVHVNTR